MMPENSNIEFPFNDGTDTGLLGQLFPPNSEQNNLIPGVDPIGIDSPFGEESVFNSSADIPNIPESTDDNTYSYKVILLKNGSDVFERHHSDSPKDTPTSKQLLIYYEIESEDTNNFFGTACRVKMGTERLILMKSLLNRKRTVSVNGDSFEATDLESWAKRLATHNREIDYKILLSAVKLELISDRDKDSFFKSLFNLNNILADLMLDGVAGMEGWKFTKENYEYGIKGYKPIIPVKAITKAADFLTSGESNEETIPGKGLAQLKSLSKNLDTIVFQAAKVATKTTLNPLDDLAVIAMKNYLEEFLPDSIKKVLKKMRTLLNQAETFIKEMASAIEKELAMLNAFLCGLISGIISLLQSIVAILALVIDNFQLFELERLSKEKLASQQRNLEFVEDLIDLISDNAKDIFNGLLKLVLTLPSDLLKLVKSLGTQIAGLSRYFWAFFIGGVLFEIVLDIVLAFLTGGGSAAAKVVEKISRMSARLANRGKTTVRKTAQKVADNSAALLKFLRKEIEAVIQALKDGKLIEYIREKIFDLFGFGKKPEFKLRGNIITLKGFKFRKIKYLKRTTAETARLRRKFDSKIRKDFIKDIIKKSNIESRLKKAGVSDDMIQRMKDKGRPPDGWQVHHQLPLDDGGTNDFKNLLLIKNEPYHKALTVYQNATTRGLKAGDVLNIDWPTFNGFVYP